MMKAGLLPRHRLLHLTTMSCLYRVHRLLTLPAPPPAHLVLRLREETESNHRLDEFRADLSSRSSCVPPPLHSATASKNPNASTSNPQREKEVYFSLHYFHSVAK